MILDHEDVRSFLRGVADERARRNPRYSLRAFARDIGVKPTRLFDIMSHRRRLSRDLAAQIAELLKLDHFEAECFASLAESSDGTSERLRRNAQSRLERLRNERRARCHSCGDALT